MDISVKQLIELNKRNGLKLVAGSKGIDNTIKNTIITDNPDYYDLLNSGEVIITTGYPFFVNKDDIEFQINTIKMLAKKDCAALAIKSKKYFDQLPVNILETAELVGLPIIEVPINMTLTQVDNMIKKEIGLDRDSLLSRTLEVHNKLMEATFGGVDRIIEEIVSIIDNPVAIVDLDWRVLSYNTDKEQKINLKLYTGKKLFFKSSIESLQLDKISEKGYLDIDYKINKDETINCIIFPINDREQIHGYILLWETNKKLQELDLIALERASVIFALDMKKTKELENKKNKIKSNFFEDLIAGKLKDVTTTTNLAELYGMDISKSYACIIVKVGLSLEDNSTSVNRINLKKSIDLVVNKAYEISDIYKSNIIHLFRGNYVIIFLPIKKTVEVLDEKNFSKKFAEELYGKLRDNLKVLDFIIGIGKSYDRVLELKNSFNEALEVINLAKKIHIENKVLHFDDYIIYHFLDSNISNNNLVKFYESTLSKLVKYDAANNTNFIETLTQYFVNGGNVSNTAKDLYLHRNTLIYRLNLISEILNVDLKDSEKVLELQLGLKAMELLKI